jgi:hypothetical protein
VGRRVDDRDLVFEDRDEGQVRSPTGMTKLIRQCREAV